MSEIILDVTRLLNRQKNSRLPTGVDRVSLAYVNHFQARSTAAIRYGGRHILLSQDESQRIFHGLLNSNKDCDLTPKLWSNRLFSQFRPSDGKNAFLFNTGHSGLEQESYPDELLRFNVRPIFMIHDVIPLTHPEYCRLGEKDKHVVRMNNFLSSGSGIIANSHSTMVEIFKFAKTHEIKMPPSVAAPLAPASLPGPSPLRPISGPYFVAIGTIEPRKNYLLLLRLWRRLVERHGEKAPKLVIIGQRGWECENIIDMFERCEQIREHVIELSSCTDAELSTYLYHSQALLFPSFTEGYGLPLIEAIKLGTPAIASNLPVYLETAGEIPEYLDPLDAMSWMDMIEKYTDLNYPGRTAQILKIKKFVTPTWDKHFQIVEEFLSRLK